MISYFCYFKNHAIGIIKKVRDKVITLAVNIGIFVLFTVKYLGTTLTTGESTFCNGVYIYSS